MIDSGSGPGNEAPGRMTSAERLDRCEHSRVYGRGDERRCGHPNLVEHPECAECAFDLGKRSGHAEAGAYYTWAEVRARLNKEFGGVPPTEGHPK